MRSINFLLTYLRKYEQSTFLETANVCRLQAMLTFKFSQEFKITGIERVGLQALVVISRSRYVVIATKPVHRLQIRPTVHN